MVDTDAEVSFYRMFSREQLSIYFRDEGIIILIMLARTSMKMPVTYSIRQMLYYTHIL